eukprot:XP_028343246.1 uncharacterized protein LOC114485647 isoform X2 [Physeter catodon]
MNAQSNDRAHEAQITPEVAKQLEDQNFLLKERLATSEFVTAQKGEELNHRDDLLVRLQSELVQEHEELVREKEEEIRNLKEQIAELKKKGSRLSNSKLFSAMWASGREYCCSACVSDAGNDDSHSELKRGQDKTTEMGGNDDSTLEYF